MFGAIWEQQKSKTKRTPPSTPTTPITSTCGQSVMKNFYFHQIDTHCFQKINKILPTVAYSTKVNPNIKMNPNTKLLKLKKKEIPNLTNICKRNKEPLRS